MTDAQAMKQIAAILDGTEWTADTVSEIATVVRAAGHKIADPDVETFDCDECYDGTVSSDICDECDERHCWKCDPCGDEEWGHAKR